MFTIAEIGQAHDGSLGLLHSYIDAVSQTGVNAIKFQIHIAEAESSAYEPFRVNFSYEDDTRFDYWKRMSFTKDQWLEIKAHCSEVDLEFIASPFSQAAVDLLEEIGIKKYKIGSGEVTNFLMLKKVCETGKPIILSSGMSSFAELDKAYDFIRSNGNELTILQCTTQYPTAAESLGLNVIHEIRERYNGVSVGLSEHTGTVYAGIAAATLGCDVLEFHTVFDKRMFGPDASSSLTIDQVSELVKAIEFIERALKSPIDKSSNTDFEEVKNIFEKSLAVNKNLMQGHVLTFEDLEAKKPKGYGIDASMFESVIGRKLKHGLSRFEFLNYQDLEG